MTSPSDAPAAVQAVLGEKRSVVVDRLGSEATLWLAVAPLWTVRVADAVGFPAQPVLDFVERAREVGWCETRGSRRPDASAGLRFWMPEEARREVIATIAERIGTEVLRKRAQDIAREVLRHPDVPTPSTLRCWAEMMRESSPGRTLVARTKEETEAGQLAQAQDLVSAGQAMAPLLEGTADLAVDRARRLTNLGARRRQDERALVRYLERPALSAAVSALLRPDTDRWALHLRGVGGVGKTMLIRHLASGRFAEEKDLGLLRVARADFDHISADYPVRRPAQLLLELSDELSLHTAAWTGADRALTSFRAAAVSAHEALSDQRAESGPLLDDPLVQRALDAFGQALERIPRDRSLPPVLLILDTCEELAKADPGNPAAPAVLATLSMLEQLHRRVPSIRVLLCGRRPLPPRDYLAPGEVAAFSRDEARDFLSRFSARPLPADLADAMIRQSAALDSPVPARGALPDQVSPFDLALHLDWADADPGLDAGQLARSGPDAYVQVRIVDRLADPAVRSALPYLALLGRCRVPTLLDVVRPGPLPEAALVARIAEQEWVDVEGDPPAVLTVHPALARRFVHYFDSDLRRQERDSAVASLSTALGARIRSQKLGEIDVDELLAALRLLPPARAAALWDDLVRRVEEPPDRWDWLDNVVPRVLGALHEEQWATGKALEATVTAAGIAARRRADVSWDAMAMWERVHATAGGHPDPAARALLRARAALGRLGGPGDAEQRWAAVPGTLRDGGGEPALAAAAVDAADRLLEAGAGELAARLARIEPFRAALAGGAGGRVRAWALLIRARSLSEGDPAEAGRILREAEDAVAAASPSDPAWADWVPPADLLARVRLERGLLARPDRYSVSQLPLRQWQSYATADLHSVDRERLASLCLQLRLDEAPLERVELDKLAGLDDYRTDRKPTASAHDLVPPLFATLAAAEVVVGRPERALALVQARRAAVLAVRDDHSDDSTLRAADLASVWIVRRLRITDERSLLVRLSLLETPKPDLLDLQDAARRAMAVVYRLAPRAVGPEVWSRPEGWHAWWQCQPGTKLPKRVEPVKWMHLSPASRGAVAQLELDLVEMRLVDQPGMQPAEQVLRDWLDRPLGRDAARSADPWTEARGRLRAVALDAGSSLPDRVPSRQLGELAFEEAELLALRLPGAAARLFEIAARAYADAGDSVGRLLALLARATVEPDKPDLRSALAVGEALALVRRRFPEVAAEIEGGQVGTPWRSWATVLADVQSAADGGARAMAAPPLAAPPTAAPPAAAPPAAAPPPEPPVEAEAAERGPARSAWMRSIAAVAVGTVIVTLVAAYAGLSALDLPIWASVAGAAITVGLPLAAWTADLLPVARGRGVGARLDPDRLQFLAVVRSKPDEETELLLRADLAGNAGPSTLARLELTLRLATLAPAVGQRHRRSRDGYQGTLRSATAGGRIDWLDAPDDDPAWWRRGEAHGRRPAGLIVLPPEEEPRAWEQILAASLGRGAAGSIDWLRRHDTAAEPVVHAGPPAVAARTPRVWQGDIERRYGATLVGWDESRVTVRHAMGRALTTSAGVRLDASGETISGGPGHLLDVTQLARGGPTLVVLQAEPVDVALDVELLDDGPERLTLASDLIEAGVPAVLVLPALPTDLARRVTLQVAAFATGRARYDELRAAWVDLRRALRPDVDPAVLDDLVLIMNKRWH